jgi:WD40 repeat protein
VLTRQVDIYALPSQNRIHTVQPGPKNGMAMSLSLFHHEKQLTLLAAFENGFASVHRLTTEGNWVLTYRTQAHSQPILSLDPRPDLKCFFTSGADAMLVKHPIPTAPQEVAKPFNPSERIIEEIDDVPKKGSSSLSGALKSDDSKSKNSQDTIFQEWKHPRKVINTKHSGQQSLEVRSDGAIFATAGWDSKIRVYSCKNLEELAVLKWHKDGAYAVSFSDVGPSPSQSVGLDTEDPGGSEAQQGENTIDLSRMSVRDRRVHRVKAAHWIAAGAKDGKVSLWDMY